MNELWVVYCELKVSAGIVQYHVTVDGVIMVPDCMLFEMHPNAPAIFTCRFTNFWALQSMALIPSSFTDVAHPFCFPLVQPTVVPCGFSG